MTFDSGSAVLRYDAIVVLDENIALLKTEEGRSIRFEIVGHADACGSRAHNLGLSERRARMVEQYVFENGLDAGQIVRTYGLGDSRPLEIKPQDDCRSEANRRVELTLAK